MCWSPVAFAPAGPLPEAALRSFFVSFFSRFMAAKDTLAGVPVFVDPRFDDSRVDLEAHLRLLAPDARCKGIFFTHFIELSRKWVEPSELLARAGIPDRRYFAFHDFPMADHLRLLVATARALHPRTSLGEGLRRIGRTAYDGLLGSHVGRVAFGALGLDLERILLLGPRAIRLVTTFDKMHAEKVSERTVQVHYREMPAFLETYHVGVLEGVLAHCNAFGRVRTNVTDIANATHEVTWD
jgi:uncharacterized protein (TIGR02265 family)